MVYVQTDGRYGPYGGNTASVHISVDGNKISNDSKIYWGKSSNKQQHSFNAIGLISLMAGTHSIELIAEHFDGAYYVGAGSNLSIMVNPAPVSVVSSLGSNSPVIDTETEGYNSPGAVPMVKVTEKQIDSKSESIIAIASGTSSHIGDLGQSSSSYYGDAMWGIYIDNTPFGYNTSAWGVNDIWTGAETTAPMYAHAFFKKDITNGYHSLSLQAGEFPWKAGYNYQSLRYKVLSSTKLILLSGGLRVAGSSIINSFDSGIHDVHAQWDYTVAGSSVYDHFPQTGQPFELTKATFNVPSDHSGIVMFSARIRVQGDSEDQGGTTLLYIEIDGTTFGSTGVQQLAHPDVASQRTLSASYLSAGSGALTPGNHEVKAIMKVDGGFKHLSVHNDLPLIWFD